MSALPERSNGRWWTLAFLMAICFFSHFNRASITSAGDERIMSQYGISPERMGVVYSSLLVVYTLFMLPGGWFVDRCGPRLALSCVVAGSALFCGLTGAIGVGWVAAGGVWMAVLVARAGMGLVTAPLHPGAARAAGNWFPAESRSLANGLITGASILAYAVVHPVFGGLIDRVEWPVAFLATGAVTLALAAAWAWWGRDRPARAVVGVDEGLADADRAEGEADPGLWTEGRGRRNLILLTLSYAAVGYFQYLFFYWLHFYYDTVLHMAKDESRFLAGLPNLAMAACMPLGGWLADRARRRWGADAARSLLPKVGMFAAAAFLAAGIGASDRHWVAGWFTLSLGALGLCEASFWTTAVEIGRRRGGTAAAIMNTGGNGIGLLAPMATPWIGRVLGWQWGLGLGAVVAVAGALCWFGIRTESRAPGDGSAASCR